MRNCFQASTSAAVRAQAEGEQQREEEESEMEVGGDCAFIFTIFASFCDFCHAQAKKQLTCSVTFRCTVSVEFLLDTKYIPR